MLLGIPALPVLGFVGYILVLEGVFDWPDRNPYERDNICFVRDLPGATDRHVQFTPVACDASRRPLGEPVGADMGELHFKDVDGDGQPEAIVESSAFKCTHRATGCYEALRVTLKVCPACNPQVSELRREFLPERSVASQ
jgi:hypothetical protein